MKYSVLGLNGGGMRGALQIGALQELSEQESEPCLHNLFPGGVYGISIGALICTFIAFEFSISEFQEFVECLGHIQDAFHPLRLQTILSLTQTKGLDDGSKIYDLLKKAFADRNLDFDTLRIGDAAIPLHIIASDLTDLKPVIFGPSIRVWDALRSSCSLPYVFTPHEFGGHLYVDGAVLCQNIMNAIPVDLRSQTLLLMTSNGREINSANYLSRVPFCRTIKETYDIHRKYPRNTCLLVETESSMFTLYESTKIVQHLLLVGRSAYREFRAEGLREELTEDGDGGRT